MMFVFILIGISKKLIRIVISQTTKLLAWLRKSSMRRQKYIICMWQTDEQYIHNELYRDLSRNMLTSLPPGIFSTQANMNIVCVKLPVQLYCLFLLILS